MAGGDLGAQQLPQRRRVVDFVRLLDATERTLQQGVLASARPGDRAYVLELNRLHVVCCAWWGGLVCWLVTYVNPSSCLL